jgi:hypothetical protein
MIYYNCYCYYLLETKKLSKNEILRLAIKYIRLLSNVLEWQKQQENVAQTVKQPQPPIIRRLPSRHNQISTTETNDNREHFTIMDPRDLLIDRHNPSHVWATYRMADNCYPSFSFSIIRYLLSQSIYTLSRRMSDNLCKPNPSTHSIQPLSLRVFSIHSPKTFFGRYKRKIALSTQQVMHCYLNGKFVHGVTAEPDSAELYSNKNTSIAHLYGYADGRTM